VLEVTQAFTTPQTF